MIDSTIYKFNNKELILNVNFEEIKRGALNLYGSCLELDLKYSLVFNLLSVKSGLTVYTSCDLLAIDEYVEVLKRGNHKVVVVLNDKEDSRHAKMACNSRLRKAFNKLKTHGVIAVKRKLKTVKKDLAA